jgi:polyhydroxyalkanoate synthesis regulator phasin
MSEESEQPMTPRQRENILRGLDKMVKKGQMTEAEAARIRESTDPEEFESAVRAVRARHASKRLDAAVQDGSMTQGEADDILVGIQKGEHSRSFRSHLRQLVHGKRSGS